MSIPEVRVLVKNDWRSMQRLRMSRTTHAGVNVSKLTSAPLFTISTTYQNHPNLAVGAFEEDKLVAFICAAGYDDHWVLDLMISNGDPKKLRPCLEACLEHFEKRKIKQFYYAFPEKWARAYRSFWKDGSPLLMKYTIEDVAIIEARKIPTDPFIWKNILNGVIVPMPFLLRRSYVK